LLVAVVGIIASIIPLNFANVNTAYLFCRTAQGGQGKQAHGTIAAIITLNFASVTA
jgi:hypothetical protein